MIAFLNLFFIVVILVLGYLKYSYHQLSIYYWPAAIIKLVAGITVGWVYTSYYPGGDSFAFFDSAIKMQEMAFTSFNSFIDIFILNDYSTIENFSYKWLPSAFFVKILALLAFITDGNYWICSLYLSLFSFFGLWYWTLTLYRITGIDLTAIISGLFIPSILFWSSGIMKESLAIPALAVLAALFLKFYIDFRLNWKQVMSMLLFLVVLAITRYFLAAAFLAAASSVFLSRKILKSNGSWFTEIIMMVTSFLIIAGVVSLIHPNLWPSRIAEVIFNNYNGYFDSAGSTNLVEYPLLTGSLASMFLSSPKALVVGLFMPLLPIKGSLISIPVIIENWFILIGSIGLLIMRPVPASREFRLLIWGGFLFIFLSAVLISLSTPNLGTLARYKTGYILIYAPMIVSALFSMYKKYLRQG